MPGCQTTKPHTSDPKVKALIDLYGTPEKMSKWGHAAVCELKESIDSDLKEGRILAWYTRLRQPEELYFTILYALFFASEKELHHILSGEQPNSFMPYYRKVNEVILGGRGMIDAALSSGSGVFSPVDLLHAGAHVSFPAFITSMSIAQDLPAASSRLAAYSGHLQKYCAYLGHLRGLFGAGREKKDALTAITNLHKDVLPKTSGTVLGAIEHASAPVPSASKP